MDDALLIHRLHFGFTAAYHYLFPQLTMGLALPIVIFKWIAIRRNDERFNTAARFWGKIFALAFAVGVVTGIPLEFQFGTNWARFSTFAGGVIGQTLAMEGMFAFFLESSFLGLFVFGERRLGRAGHFVAAILVFLGSWLSAYFIVVTNAWMQSPVAYAMAQDGSVQLQEYWALLFNPWAGWQYFHTMCGAVVTGSFVMASVGAYYLLARTQTEQGKLFVRTGIIAGCAASVLLAFPSGDGQGRNVALHQPATLAAMEGLFRTEEGAPIVIVGQPDMERMRLDNPIHIPRLLSFLTYARWNAEVKGLDAVPRENWPDNIPLLYYSYHIMVGLGTIFIAILAIGAFMLWRRALYDSRPFLWVVMLAFPFPFIANTAGWMTAELGRQPWLVYGLLRTSFGTSATVSAGNGLFTLLGFLGLYFIIGVLFLILVLKKIGEGPADAPRREEAR